MAKEQRGSGSYAPGVRKNKEGCGTKGNLDGGGDVLSGLREMPARGVVTKCSTIYL